MAWYTFLNGWRVCGASAFLKIFRSVKVASINGDLFEVDSSSSLDRELLRRGEHESDLILARELAKSLPARDIFLDIGANAGY